MEDERMTVSLASVTLDDKYNTSAERIYISGIQALVRLPIMQRQRDRALGLNTAGFISGYRGSPLGVYDNALWAARKHLDANQIQFRPGLNEDLAATAVWGSQQVGLFPGATVDGAFGIWYGKGPGLDRSLDALKHANSAGTSRLGGVLAIAGDDHGCQSSTLAHQSEQVFQSAMIPVINPATVQEYLDFGLYGFGLSRFSGCWVGFKAISETVESSASVYADPRRLEIILPEDFELPPGGLNIRWPNPPLEQERRLHGPKMAAVAAFARANAFDRTVIDSESARLGIMTTGKAYLDVMQALSDLGITQERARSLGLRIYKVGLTWPLEREGALRFTKGLKDVLVVEEKRAFLQTQLVELLYNAAAAERPSVVGKQDETGAPLLPSEGELSSTIVARALLRRLERLGHSDEALSQRLARLESFDAASKAAASDSVRTPFFCSGCPHNTSTNVPEGSRALAGIGCHGMVLSMPSRRTATITHMGGEGANWIGQAPFTKEPHVFQNLGDGTYTHSGLLAIRAAAAAGVNITYKILYNDAVAMTGGQRADAGLSVGQVAHQVVAEGAKRVAVVTDEPDKYTVGTFPASVSIHHRDELDAVQRTLREISGLTVLIYDQTCAAEKRRRRKRGLLPDPPKHMFINELVCEGCGDCSRKSNCISVRPVETDLGRKRQIDQSNCNKDYACVGGFCPSFVTVEGGSLRKQQEAEVGTPVAMTTELLETVPLPQQGSLVRPYGILIAGIGGTGVITLGALLGMAAHLEGKGCTVLDFTGLAQKNGAVTSHVRLAPKPEDLSAVRIGPGGADLLLGCDMVVAASRPAITRMQEGVSHALINDYVQPTAGFIGNPDLDFKGNAMRDTLRAAVGNDRIDFLNATELATSLMGNSIAANLFLLGYAFQKGLIPLSLQAIQRAIELNGTGADSNRRAFGWGRLAVHDPASVQQAAGPLRPENVRPTLNHLIDSRAAFLTKYQDAALATQYLDAVARVRTAEESNTPGLTSLTEAVAINLFKLMAYKDEYEVARLYTDGSFEKELRRQFVGPYKLTFHLAPPLFARRDPTSGHLKKRAYGPWMWHAFRVLAGLRRLRGTAFDPFGYTAERRGERRILAEYEATLNELAGRLTPSNHPVALALAEVPAQIRGYGHIKEANLIAAKAKWADLLQKLREPEILSRAAE